MPNYSYEKLLSLYNQGVRILFLESYGDNEEMCIQDNDEIILFFNKKEEGDDDEPERLQNEISDRLGETDAWLSSELDRILDRINNDFDLSASEYDVVNYFRYVVSCRPQFESKGELYAYLMGVCQGSSILFDFADEAVELLTGLADRFAEEFELPLYRADWGWDVMVPIDHSGALTSAAS